MEVTQLAVGLDAAFKAGQSFQHPLAAGRCAWVQVAEGEITLNGQVLRAGDGAAPGEEAAVNVSGRKPSQVLLFDLN